jgi:hypothetical protein
MMFFIEKWPIIQDTRQFGDAGQMVKSNEVRNLWGLPRRAWNVVGLLFFAVVLAALVWRQVHIVVIDGEVERSAELGRDGLADFRDVIHYPLKAMREGVNPYDGDAAPLADGSPRYSQRYPVGGALPLYSPLIFLLYWPFSYGSFYASAGVYVALNVGLLALWAWACWRVAGVWPSVGQTTMLAGVMLATQSGRANFLGGETAIPLALASLLAVWMAPSRPWLAGVALSITSFKPTFGLPLGILLLASGHFRTVALGWGLGFLIAVGGLAVVFATSGDLARMPEVLLHNQEVVESDPELNPQTSRARFDSAGAIQRLLGMEGSMVGLLASGAILGFACAGLWRLRPGHHDLRYTRLTTAIVCVATVSGIFHMPYDGLLLWAPIAIVVLSPDRACPIGSRGQRWLIGGLLVAPMFHVLGTTTVQRWVQSVLPVASIPSSVSEFGWTLICTFNGISLLLSLVLLVRHALVTETSPNDAMPPSAAT